MQSDISTCASTDPWKLSNTVCGFVNNLAPRAENPPLFCQDKDGHSTQAASCEQRVDQIDCNRSTRPPRMGRMKRKPIKVRPLLTMKPNPGSEQFDCIVGENESAKNADDKRLTSVSSDNKNDENYQSKMDGLEVDSVFGVTESMNISGPITELSDSSLSQKSENSIEDTNLMISTDKQSSLSRSPSPVNLMIDLNDSKTMESPFSKTDTPEASVEKTNQIDLNRGSPVSNSSYHQLSDEDTNASLSLINNSNQNDQQNGNDGGSLTIDDKGDELDTSVESKKTSRSLKLMRCKMCNTEHYGKETLWMHLRNDHPKENHLLCDYCPFATRYRHHYEYHVRNHRGEKPFKCEQCGYRCVNKSMLASHMKSHTTVYEYKCETCSYETKYYHSLKQHIEKTNHVPVMDKGILLKKETDEIKPAEPSTNNNIDNNNGFQIGMLPLNTGAGLPIINGVNLIPPPPPLHSRPFPQQITETDIVTTNGQPLQPSSLQPPLFLSPVSKENSFSLINHPATSIVGPLTNQVMAIQIQNALSILNEMGQKKLEATEQISGQNLLHDTIAASNIPDASNDLSVSPFHMLPKRIKTEICDSENESYAPGHRSEVRNSDDIKKQSKTKGKDSDIEKSTSTCGKDINLSKLSFCKHCEVYFVDPVAYQVHAGNHNYDDPFKCNRCGHRANDAISFMNHGLCAKH